MHIQGAQRDEDHRGDRTQAGVKMSNDCIVRFSCTAAHRLHCRSLGEMSALGVRGFHEIDLLTKTWIIVGGTQVVLTCQIFGFPFNFTQFHHLYLDSKMKGSP